MINVVVRMSHQYSNSRTVLNIKVHSVPIYSMRGEVGWGLHVTGLVARPVAIQNPNKSGQLDQVEGNHVTDQLMCCQLAGVARGYSGGYTWS